MAIKVKAVERKLKVGKDAGQYCYMMQAEIYNTLNAQKVISEASVRSGIQEGALSAAWDAIGRVIKVWATEGHSIAIPGLGRMRFGVRATSVGDVNKVSTSLITARRVIFSPSVEIKDELRDTAINITCYDRDGNVVKRVKSEDAGEVEDPENGATDNTDNNGATDNTDNTENNGGGSSNTNNTNPGGGEDDGTGEND